MGCQHVVLCLRVAGANDAKLQALPNTLAADSLAAQVTLSAAQQAKNKQSLPAGTTYAQLGTLQDQMPQSLTAQQALQDTVAAAQQWQDAAVSASQGAHAGGIINGNSSSSGAGVEGAVSSTSSISSRVYDGKSGHSIVVPPWPNSAVQHHGNAANAMTSRGTSDSSSSSSSSSSDSIPWVSAAQVVKLTEAYSKALSALSQSLTQTRQRAEEATALKVALDGLHARQRQQFQPMERKQAGANASTLGQQHQHNHHHQQQQQRHSKAVGGLRAAP
jgi:hypothetical protein